MKITSKSWIIIAIFGKGFDERIFTPQELQLQNENNTTLENYFEKKTIKGMKFYLSNNDEKEERK